MDTNIISKVTAAITFTAILTGCGTVSNRSNAAWSDNHDTPRGQIGHIYAVRRSEAPRGQIGHIYAVRRSEAPRGQIGHIYAVRRSEAPRGQIGQVYAVNTIHVREHILPENKRCI